MPQPRLWISSRRARPDAVHALVDVVGGDAQHAARLRCAMRTGHRIGRHQPCNSAAAGSPRRWTARSRRRRPRASGSHRSAVCSRGFSRHRRAARHAQAEHVLGVVRHAGRIAVPPARVDVVDVVAGPSRAGTACTAGRADLDAGLLDHLAHGGLARASSARSFEPVTVCQKPGASARSISSTSSVGVWITTSTDSGS